MFQSMNFRTYPVWGMLLILVLLPGTTSAQGALQRIPENTLGFALVQNLAEASEKFEQLLEPFVGVFPAPLAFAKIVTGMGAGLDVSGDLVIGLLPGKGPEAAIEPLVLLPISNYKLFAASVNADASGDLCRITVLGEDILVAQNGSCAMLMNVEHRGTMEALIGLPPESVTALEPLATWLPKQDVVFVLMPTGIQRLSNWKPPVTGRFEIGYEHPRSGSTLSQLRSLFWGPETGRWLRNHVELVALGVSVDELSNVYLGEQLVLKKKNSPLAHLAPPAIGQPSAKLGLSSKPCVFTAGGPVGPGWGKQLASFLLESEQKKGNEQGLKENAFDPHGKELRAYQLLLQDIRALSVVMLTGETGEPLMGNFLGIATVPDVSKYLDSLPQVIDTWNEITQQSTSDIQPDFTLTSEKIAGKRRCEIVVDIGSALQDPNVPIINWMLEAMLGLEGKLRMQFAEVDATTFVFGLATQQQMTELLTTVQQNKSTTLHNPEFQATLDLLQPTSLWRALVSPQGCLRWTSRFYNEYLVLLSNQEMTLPPLPDSPPFGLTVHCSARRWECELVCPAATWVVLGKYLARIFHPSRSEGF